MTTRNEKKNKDVNDYRLIGLPLGMRVTDNRTKPREGHKPSENCDQTLKLQEFNRHYGGDFFHYKKDLMVEHPSKVRKYMETNPGLIDFPVTTTPLTEDYDIASDASPSRTQLPVPPKSSSSEQPLIEDRYHGWVDMTSHQLLHFHSWHVPCEAMDNYMKAHTNDPEVYVDFTTFYRENELPEMYSAYGGLLNGPTWARFVRWWHREHRTYSSTNSERQKELKFELANYLDQDGWNYINGISHGCTKFADPQKIVEHKEINYLILQACNFYELADKSQWTSPLLTALRTNQMLPTTESDRFIAPAAGDEVAHYDAIDSLIDFGTKTLKNMEAAWVTAVETTTETTTSGGDLRTTMETIRSDVRFRAPTRSRL